jgi:hypothetical protein
MNQLNSKIKFFPISIYVLTDYMSDKVWVYISMSNEWESMKRILTRRKEIEIQLFFYVYFFLVLRPLIQVIISHMIHFRRKSTCLLSMLSDNIRLKRCFAWIFFFYSVLYTRVSCFYYLKSFIIIVNPLDFRLNTNTNYPIFSTQLYLCTISIVNQSIFLSSRFSNSFVFDSKHDDTRENIVHYF